MKKILFPFFLLIFTAFLYASSVRTTNFTADNAGTYALSKVVTTSNGVTSTITISDNEVCAVSEGQSYCNPVSGVLYELIIDSSGDVTISQYDSTYIELDTGKVGSIYDEEGVAFTFDDVSLQVCEQDTYGSYCATFAKKNSAVVTPLDIKQVESAKSQQVTYINSLQSYEYGSPEQIERIHAIKKELENSSAVEKVETTESGTALWVSYNAGFDGIIAVTPDESKGNSANQKILEQLVDKESVKAKIFSENNALELIKTIKEQSSIKKSVPRLSGYIGNKKVLSLTAQYYAWGENDDIPVISEMLEKQGYDVTYKKYRALNSGDIEDFKNWDKYGIVLLSSHGEASKTKTAIHINAIIDVLKYQEDLKAKRIVVWGNSYGVTQEFIKKYNDNFPNTLVYMSICKGAYNDTMADVLTSKGAASYIGYDNYVDVSFAKTYGVKLFEDLLKSGANLSTAYKVGIKEDDEDPAELKLFGTSNLSIQVAGVETLDVEKSVEDTVVDAVTQGSQVIAGHFIHYGEGSFDWVYISTNGSGIYKLNGIKANGITFDWSENLASSFSSVAIEEDGKHVIFGTSSSENEAAKAIQEKTLNVDGHFVHYAEGSFDWIYITPSGKGVYKLNGLAANGKFDWSSNIADKFSAVTIDKNSKSIAFKF